MKNKKLSFGDFLFVLACTLPGLYIGIFNFSWRSFAVIIMVFAGLILGALLAIIYRN